MKSLNIKSIMASAILVLILCSASTLLAQESPGSDSWKFFGELYFMGASIGGKSATGSKIDLDFDDIISDVSFAFMGTAGVSKGKWSLGADLMNFTDKTDAFLMGENTYKLVMPANVPAKDFWSLTIYDAETR